MYIEKMNYTYKQKELSEKRYELEKRKVMISFGMARAEKKSETERKNNIKQILNSNRIDDMQTFTKINENLQKRDVENRQGNQINNFKININKIKNIKNIKENVQIPIIVSSSLSLNANANVNDTKKINEVVVNIKTDMKSDMDHNHIIEGLKEKLEKEFEGEKIPELPSDALSAANNNPLFNARFTNHKHLNLKQIDQTKTQYSLHYRPMSVFDITNLSNINSNADFKQKPKNVNLHRPSTSCDFNSLDPENNPLNRRRLLSGSKNFDVNRIKNSLLRKNIQIEGIKDQLLQPEQMISYGMSFLPVAGFNLKPKEETKKAKK